MAQYFDDFSGYTIGLQPPTWQIGPNNNGTATVETLVDASNGVALRVAPNSRYHAVLYTPAGLSDDTEIVMRVKMFDLLNFGMSNGSCHRNDSGTADQNCYHIGFFNDSINRLSISREGAATLASELISAIGDGNWTQHRSRVASNNQQLWQWADGGTVKTRSDPDDLSTVDSFYPGAGRTGIFADYSGSTVLWVDWIGIGTAGDEAPTQPIDPPAPGGGGGGIADLVIAEAIYTTIYAGISA